LADNRQNDDLDARIAKAKAEHNTGATSAQGASESRGWAIGIEFIGVVLVSALIGWAIDHYTGLGTAPWAMIVMLVLGFIAGVYRAMKTSSQFDAE
jgi:ATP synthase protein I